MIAEWWAYLGDILTFYNERIANEDYLRTAVQTGSLRGLIRLLGYRPQPGIGAKATVAALLQSGPTFGRTTILPARMQVQSKPGPGEAPQIFELTANTRITEPDLVPATPELAMLAPDPGTLLLDGAVSGIIGGADLVLRPRDGSKPHLVEVTKATIVTLPGGAKQTVLSVKFPDGAPTGPAASFRLEQANQSTGLFSFGGSTGISGLVLAAIHLSGLVRSLRLQDTVLIAVGRRRLLTSITQLADEIWDAAGKPSTSSTRAIFPHTVIVVADSLPGTPSAANVTVYYGWVEAGRLLDQPVTTWPPADPPSTTGTLVPAGTTLFPPSSTSANVLIADSTGAGTAAQASSPNKGRTLAISGVSVPQQSMQTPLAVMFNLLQLTRGKTVPQEVLGSGNPTQANQSFKLAKSPLTYLREGNAVVSTLAITVNKQAWTEVDNFYGQPPDARVFVTMQDDAGNSTVHFGDGVNGARLPAGSGNVLATYRIGSGAAAPPAGTLTVIANPIPGLRALRNPVAAGGGSDPDPPDMIRTYAPRSVLTFNRAVSALDFEAIAASVANGSRVRATWAWDSSRHRAAVTIHVAGDATTIDEVRAALAEAGDPNRPVNVVPAQPLNIVLVMVALVSPSVTAAHVKARLTAALTDPSHGLFGAARLGIGEPVFDSQIAAACQAVSGVAAISFLGFWRAGGANPFFHWWWETTPLHVPPEGQYFNLDPSLVFVFTEPAANGG
jgi:hypothetical protein